MLPLSCSDGNNPGPFREERIKAQRAAEREAPRGRVHASRDASDPEHASQEDLGVGTTVRKL